MAKTGAHFTPCNVGSVEKHNERDPEYLKSVEASGRNIYFFQDQTRNNSSWVNPDYHGMSCKEIFERLKQLYIEKVGQAPQLNDRERVNKKTGRVYKVAGWSPIREAVIPTKEDTTLADFKPVVDWLKGKGWNVIRIDLHKDEGYENQVTGNKKMNYHAHLVVDCLDHNTGRTVKLSDDDMSLKGIQGIIADALGMERGNAKEVSGVNHRTVEQQREWAAAQHVIELDKEARRNEIKAKGLFKMIENLTNSRNYLFEEIRQLEEDAKVGKISVDELQQKVQVLRQEIEETEKKIKDKEEKLSQTKKQLDSTADQLEKMLDQKADAQHQYDDLRRAINRDLPTLEGRVIRDFQAMGWKMAAQESKNVLEKIAEHSLALSSLPMAKHQFDEAVGMTFYGNIIGEMAIRGEEITLVAGALYLGLIDQAMEFAQSHGGGDSSPDNGWGRRPDEDDEAFKMRCFGMARMIMKPAGRSQQQSNGLKR